MTGIDYKKIWDDAYKEFWHASDYEPGGKAAAEVIRKAFEAATDEPGGYHVEIGGQRFTESQWEAVQLWHAGSTAATASDTDLVTWTPDDGSFLEAIKDLPSDWEITAKTTITAGEIRRTYTMPTTFASWKRPASAWVIPRPPLVIETAGDDVWYLLPGDGILYRSGVHFGATPEEIDREYGPVTVLIDADGHYVGGCNE